MTLRRSGSGVWRRVRARPALAGLVAAAAMAGVVFVLVWFEPQALLYDRVVEEEFPATQAGGEPAGPETPGAESPTDVATGEAARVDAETDAEVDAVTDVEPAPDGGEADGPTPEPSEPAQQAEPAAVAGGTFESRNRYTVVGTATVYDLGETRVLRLEDFESTNGPDLFVYLTAADQDDSDAALDEDFVNLGELRGNVGSQNYDIPDDVDLTRYDTVVIWCRRFTVGFGAADLRGT